MFEVCYFARVLWSVLAALFDLGSLPRQPLQLMRHVRGLSMSSQIRALWLVGFLEVIWLVWVAQNQAKHGGRVWPLAAMVRKLCLSISEAKVHRVGVMDNSLRDLMILNRLGIAGLPRKPPQVIPIVLCLQGRDELRLMLMGQHRVLLAEQLRGVFRLPDGRVHLAFSAALGTCTAFEAEAKTVIIAIRQACTLGL